MMLIDHSGKKVAMVLWNKEDKSDVQVFLGEIIICEMQYHFINIERNWDLLLTDDALSTMRTVPAELRSVLLDADLSFSLFVTDMPENADSNTYIKTGISLKTPG